LACG
jgi:hypothetical protein